ncbi:MAG: DNA-binding protein [Polaromonas sp.]
MQVISSRGVQQEDVWRAADALIAEGLRPTIERVRQKIGRGSPNTVSPLLETWFATLAGRLGVGSGSKNGGGDLPQPVQQAAAMLWDTALRSARERAEQELAQAGQALAADRAGLELREADLLVDKQALIERQIAVDEVLQVSRAQLADMTARLEQARVLQVRREREIDELREKLALRESERDADLQRHDEEAKRHAEERARLDARATANERRLLEELDRERQEVKRARAAQLESERRAVAAQTRLETANTSMATRMQEIEHDLGVERQALASANERATELRNLLDAQKEANTATLKQLNLLLVNSARKTLARLPIRRRRI